MATDEEINAHLDALKRERAAGEAMAAATDAMITAKERMDAAHRAFLDSDTSETRGAYVAAFRLEREAFLARQVAEDAHDDATFAAKKTYAILHPEKIRG